MTITATVVSQPITASVSGSGVIAANVGSSTVSSAASGGIGPQGPAGVKGDVGATGAAGADGAQGPAGATGARGDTGGVGPRGEQGVAGAAGATGPQGVPGAAGADGAQGPAGVAGAKGDTGSVGPQGIQGVAGATGPQGIQGLHGIAGPKGDTGERGDAGPQGIQGVAGATGPAGAAGATGTQGQQGVAGATGSVGPQGPAGSTGATGPAASLVYASVADFPATGSATALYLDESSSRLFQWESPVYVEVGVSGGGVATTSASDLVDGTLADARLSANVVLTGDSRLSDSRSPTSHASSHASGGADALTLAASQIGSGTLADARLSSNVPRLENLASWASQPSTAIETFPRSHLVFSGSLLVSGQVIFVFFTPLVTTTVSQISMGVVSTAASGLTLARMGLFTFNESTATLVARTASDTTLFTATRTIYTRSFDSSSGGFPATYTLTAGTRYGVGVIAVGTTMPLLSGTTPPFEIASLPPKLSAARSGQSDLATFGSLGTTSAIPYARLS